VPHVHAVDAAGSASASAEVGLTDARLIARKMERRERDLMSIVDFVRRGAQFACLIPTRYVGLSDCAGRTVIS
jgi:hypothetical protein